MSISPGFTTASRRCVAAPGGFCEALRPGAVMLTNRKAFLGHAENLSKRLHFEHFRRPERQGALFAISRLGDVWAPRFHVPPPALACLSPTLRWLPPGVFALVSAQQGGAGCHRAAQQTLNQVGLVRSI